MSRTGKQAALAVAAVALGLLGAGVLVATRPRAPVHTPKRVLPQVEVVRVHRAPVELRVHAYGTVEPRAEADLVAEVAGRVVWVSPALVDGGRFRAGDPLLRIERSDYELALARAEAVRDQRAAELERAEHELARTRQLAARGAASRARLEDAESAVRAARAALSAARVAAERARLDLERTEVRAPFDGRVREEHVSVGGFLARGASLAHVYATDRVEIRFPLGEDELARLDPQWLATGEAAPDAAPRVVVHARLGGRAHDYVGRLVRSEGAIDPKTRTLTVVAEVDDPETAIPPLAVGLFVEAEIEGRRVADAAVLPPEALRAPGRVWVVDARGRLHRREVETLAAEPDRVVVGAGLEDGERVCVTLLESMVDGMEVRAVERSREGGAAAREGSPA